MKGRAYPLITILVDRDGDLTEVVGILEKEERDVQKGGPIYIIIQPPVNACDEVTDKN
jgi:hypothetical protein